MVIGVVREIKTDENRVALTPAGVSSLVRDGHRVLIEQGCGMGSGFTDDEYAAAGGVLLADREQVWADAQMIVKVKEPLEEEYPFFRSDLILFTYLHLAPAPDLTQALLRSKITGIAYETVQLADGSLPLLTPMSEVAGRMAAQIGAQFLEKRHGGRGILLGGVPGVEPGHVLVIGGGVVGSNAARIALGLGAEVTVVDVNADRLRQLDDQFQGRLRTLMSSEYSIAQILPKTDLLVGAVLVPGSRAPHLVSEAMVKTMPKGSVIVDVAIDQGGSIATIDRTTTHSHPTYEKFGVVHYAVANMPGAVPRTSTLALTNVTLPYVRKLSQLGLAGALRDDPALARGLNVYQGSVTYQAVAQAQDLVYEDASAFFQ
ncbi:MAG: alanine dehydrogenase [Sulfobacillus acidophilus]|uniref:Alanine dehydrogenase n=1 Tax=Sulfobacillus acidophilus TaxID=53633 RepID=A0A2T2WF32_9FIRM|nr:MAG: alanine dehydrogenase [Sulfobacillus acidophilus]